MQKERTIELASSYNISLEDAEKLNIKDIIVKGTPRIKLIEWNSNHNVVGNKFFICTQNDTNLILTEDTIGDYFLYDLDVSLEFVCNDMMMYYGISEITEDSYFTVVVIFDNKEVVYVM